MTSKFRIFCDEPQQTGERDIKQKREPLALKQHLVYRPHLKQQDSQQQPLQQLHQQYHQPPALSSNASPSSSSHDQDLGQENDISIASLGSDFVPSIYEEEFGGFESDAASDDDSDIDLDEEVQLELSSAFKKHDENSYHNCAVFKNDILDYLYDLEMNPDLRPTPNYMLFHQFIDSEKRSILINWLVEVSEEYELQSETLFICIGIIDRFLSKMSISTSHLQLLGVAAMFMATKYEEIYPPELNQFVEVTDETFSGRQIIQMEQEILKTLDFRISMPTITFFLRQIFAYNKFTKKVYNLAEYLCYLSLLEDQPFLGYYPSEIALAAVILAAHQLDAAANISTELKSSYDKSNQAQILRRDAFNDHDNDRKVLPFCIESLRAIQASVSTSSAVYVTFASTAHDQVALLPPLKLEDLHKCA